MCSLVFLRKLIHKLAELCIVLIPLFVWAELKSNTPSWCGAV